MKKIKSLIKSIFAPRQPCPEYVDPILGVMVYVDDYESWQYQLLINGNHVPVYVDGDWGSSSLVQPAQKLLDWCYTVNENPNDFIETIKSFINDEEKSIESYTMNSILIGSYDKVGQVVISVSDELNQEWHVEMVDFVARAILKL